MREVMLILHFVGLSMGLGTSSGMTFLGSIVPKLPKEEVKDYLIRILVLGKMGSYGLVLLLISGGYLMTPYWSILGSKPTLIIKLSLVVVLMGLFGMVSANGKKARETREEKYLKKIKMFGQIALPTGILIVIFAVLTFK